MFIVTMYTYVYAWKEKKLVVKIREKYVVKDREK